MSDYDSNKAPWEDRKSAIQSVIIEEGVMSIGMQRDGVGQYPIHFELNRIESFHRLQQTAENRRLEDNPKYAAEDGVLFERKRHAFSLSLRPEAEGSLFRVQSRMLAMVHSADALVWFS